MLAEPDSQVLWQAECDPHALTVLAHHFPTVRRYTDVRDIDERAARVDVVCGGFPCQPHSLAGKRKGTSDERWIWPEFARIVGVLRPSLVFVENVPGLRTSGLQDVLADLASLGFDAEWDLFQAAEAGAPHRRRRLFVLAYANGDRLRQQRGRTGREGGEGAPISEFHGPPWIAPNSNRAWGLQPGGGIGKQWRWTGNSDRWAFESPFSGVAHGVSRRLDRHRLTGNAVVPQQAEIAWRELTARAMEAT